MAPHAAPLCWYAAEAKQAALDWCQPEEGGHNSPRVTGGEILSSQVSELLGVGSSTCVQQSKSACWQVFIVSVLAALAFVHCTGRR